MHLSAMINNLTELYLNHALMSSMIPVSSACSPKTYTCISCITSTHLVQNSASKLLSEYFEMSLD